MCCYPCIGVLQCFFRHSKISVNDVKSITVGKTIYRADSNINEIADIVSMFNNAARFNGIWGTTPSNIVLVKLNNDKEIEITRTT